MTTGWEPLGRPDKSLKNDSKIVCGAAFQLASIDGDGITGLMASWITRPSDES